MFKILKLASIGVLFILSNPCIAQEYLWPLEDAEWWVESSLLASVIVSDSAGIGEVETGFTTTQIYYELGMDSTINSENYTTLYQTYESSFLSVDGTYSVDFPPVTIPEFRGGFRVEGQQVYFWDAITSQAYLLYDYEMEVGEFVPHSYVSTTENKEVIGIETITIDEAPARVYSLSGPGMSGNVIVEGVGSLFGPIQNLAIGFDSSHQLICHSRNGVAVYPFSDGCAGMVTNTMQAELDDFSVYPNPTNGLLSFNLNGSNYVSAVSLYNMLGACVADFNHEFKSGFIEMPIELQDGIYLLKLKMNDGSSAFQRIVLERN